MRSKVIIVLVVGVFAFQWMRHERARRMPVPAPAAVTWMTDAPAALARASSESKTLLMDFTGSDWCGWCIKLDEEVFATTEFARYANEHLVLLKVDFPRTKKQNPAEAQQNEELSRNYGIRGFPTILVLNSDGREKGRLGYQAGGPKNWLRSVEALR